MSKDRKPIGKDFRTGINIYSWIKKSNKPIRKETPKRAKQTRQYLSKSRPEYLADHPECEIMVNGCTGMSTQIHHKKGRIEELLNDKRYFCACCQNCHDWAEANPAAAYEAGVSISRVATTHREDIIE